MIVDSIRRSMAIYINQNIYTIKVNVRTKIDNGYNKIIPDLDASPILTTLGQARIARRRLPEPIIANAVTPYDYQDVYYLLAEYDVTWLKKGLVFEYYGKKYRTGIVENRIVGGGIAYQLCNLEEVTSADIGDFYA
jgi:hypothetical protein